MSWMRHLFALTLLVSLGSLASAQLLEKIPEIEIERETVLDDDGLKQWVPYDHKCPPCKGRGVNTCAGCNGVEMPNCTECDGKKTAPCRTCTGSGKLHDPMEALPCPFCTGSGWFNCGQCVGFGEFRTSTPEGITNTVKCTGCKKKGRFECLVCEGEGKLPTIRFKKKSPSEVKLKDIVKVQEGVKEALEYLEALEPTERISKVHKAMEKNLKPHYRTYVRLKPMMEQLDVILDTVHKAGAAYANYEAKLQHRLLSTRNRGIYLLRYQSRVLELCAERAEHNESVK